MITIYSYSEEQFMQRVQGIKTRVFAPLVAPLLRMGVTANGISIFSAFVVCAGAVIGIVLSNEALFLLALWSHFLLDGIDGTLARAEGTTSARGILMDVGADSVGIIALSAVMVAFGNVSAILGIIFCAGYLAVNAISVLLMQKGARYQFVIRPRIYIFVPLTADVIFAWQTTYYFVVIASVILVYFTIKGVQLLNRL